MKCPNCGNELPDNARFCTNCGIKIVATQKKINTEDLSSGGLSTNAHSNIDTYNISTNNAPENNKKQLVSKEKNVYIVISIAAVIAVIGGFLVRQNREASVAVESTTVANETVNEGDFTSESDEEQRDVYDASTENYEIEEAEETYYEDSYEDENEAGEYILPNSDREYISWSDLEGLSEWEVRIARNEIMARHGRKFNTESLQEYFKSCSWYEGTVEPADFDRNYETILNQYEKKNAETIKEYEKEKGYNR